MEGQSSEWWPMPGPAPGVNDWLCPECISELATLSIEDLRTVCIHCVQKLQQSATHVVANDQGGEQQEPLAIFEITDENETLAMFTFHDGGEIDLIGMAFKEPDGELRTTLRLKNLDGSKSVYEIKPKAGQTQDEFVAQFRDQFEQHKKDFPDALARYVGPPEAADLSVKDVLVFLMSGALQEEGATQC